jgi:hypothetical protein
MSLIRGEPQSSALIHQVLLLPLTGRSARLWLQQSPTELA